MRSLLLAMLVVSGCVESADEPAPPRITIVRDAVDVDPQPEQADVCAIANQLASDNVCSLICDPDAMAEFLVAGGMQSGKCVELRCELPGTQAVLVGVCLP